MQSYGIPSCVGPGAAGHTPGQSYWPLDEFHLQGFGVIDAGKLVVVFVVVLIVVPIAVLVLVDDGVDAPGTPTQTKKSTCKYWQARF